jgi:bifunctional oligoribonuclease and PAP phosphatase NrnA
MDFTQAAKLILNAKNIVLTTHTVPDPDGLGSVIALSSSLKKLKKNVKIVLEKKISPKYSYLDKENQVQPITGFETGKNIDLFIVLDANNLERVGDKVKLINQSSRELLFIDHHPCSIEVKALHLIDTSFVATGEIVANLIKYLGIAIDKEIALCLYTAILIDTSSFNYPTMKSRTHQVIAELIDAGVSPGDAFRKVNNQQNLDFIYLTGLVLKNCKVVEKVIHSSITQGQLKKFNTSIDNTFGLINYFIHVQNIEIACMFFELSSNQTKVSFRSFTGLDVGSIAENFGGGGHTYSSATVMNCNVKSAQQKIIPKLNIIISKIRGQLP